MFCYKCAIMIAWGVLIPKMYCCLSEIQISLGILHFYFLNLTILEIVINKNAENQSKVKRRLFCKLRKLLQISTYGQKKITKETIKYLKENEMEGGKKKKKIHPTRYPNHCKGMCLFF